MEEVKTVLQSQITSDDEDEEVSLQFIDEIVANSAAQKGESQTDVYTPSFAEDEWTMTGNHRRLRSKRWSMMLIQSTKLKSTTEFPKSSDKVIEEVEAENQQWKFKSGRTSEEDYEGSGPRSFDPEEHLANHELLDARIQGRVHQV